MKASSGEKTRDEDQVDGAQHHRGPDGQDQAGVDDLAPVVLREEPDHRVVEAEERELHDQARGRDQCRGQAYVPDRVVVGRQQPEHESRAGDHHLVQDDEERVLEQLDAKLSPDAGNVGLGSAHNILFTL